MRAYSHVRSHREQEKKRSSDETRDYQTPTRTRTRNLAPSAYIIKVAASLNRPDGIKAPKAADNCYKPPVNTCNID